MKSIILFSSIIWLIALCACSKDGHINHEPLFKDDGIPSPVSNIRVSNIPGGAIITYDLPKDTSILYVQADYFINENTVRQAKTSYYGDTIIVSGFPRQGSYKVSIASVSRSEVKSKATEVIVNPLEPPFETIFSTLRVVTAFGGINVGYQNPTGADVGIGVLLDTAAMIENIYTEYTKLKNGDFTVRGFEPKSDKFGVYVIDRWGNTSDTVWKVLTPLFESALDRKIWQNANLPGDGKAGWGSSFQPMITDLGQSSLGYAILNSEGKSPIMTIYLGRSAKLSRIKLYQTNSNGPYDNMNPRVFQVWVSSNPNPDGSLDASWTMLGEYEIEKPSKQPPGNNTAQDLAAAKNGHEFVFPLPAVDCQYVRIVGIHSWAMEYTDRMKISSVFLWGAYN